MEIAGVVLGAVPIIMGALERYRDAYEIAKDAWDWLATIEEIQNDVFLQTEQLRATLRSIEIEWVEGRPLQARDIEAALSRRRPDQCQRFMSIIQSMDTMLNHIEEDLKPQAAGPPGWSDTDTSRVRWEWQMVRLCFKKSRRKQIVSQLSTMNQALRNCGLGGSELLTDQGQRRADNIRKQFDDKTVISIRKNTIALHKAVASSWGCSCAGPHEGNIRLDWHSAARPRSNTFSLALPCTDSLSSQNSTALVKWQIVSACVQDVKSKFDRNDPGPVSKKQTTVQPTPVKNRRIKFLDTFKRNRPSDKVTSNTKAFQLDAKASNTDTTALSTSSKTSATIVPTAIPLHLCGFANQQNPPVSLQGTIAVPDPEMRLEVQFLPTEGHAKGHLLDNKNQTSLHSLLSGKSPQSPIRLPKLSRTDRFNIAAALTWGVLHLCDSPWMESQINNKAINLSIGTNGQYKGIQVTPYPFLTSTFAALGSTPDSAQQSPPSYQAASNQIENITLYTLAIRLIELGLNRDFETLRSEYERDENLQPSTDSHRDLQAALYCVEQLDLDVGINYGNAVKRCLKFLFPEPPVNSFSYVTFRQAFFNDVVAPVQAALEVNMDL